MAAVQAGYAVDGPVLDVGAFIVDGEPAPETQVRIPIGMLNRHGLIAGATGTGKTRTLQVMAEQRSANMKTRPSEDSWMSFSPRTLDSSVGPKDVIVARTGTPAPSPPRA